MTRNHSVPASGLDDAVLTHPPRAHNLWAWLRDGADRLVGADPGLNQLRTALLAVLGIGAGLGLAYLFERLTGALQLPAGTAPAPVLSAEDHAMVLIVMLLAGLVAMQDALAVRERTLPGQALFTLFMPVPMMATLVLGLLIGPYRIPSLVFTVAALAAAVYLRRFGQRGLGAGTAVFFGAFLAFFLHTELGLRDAGWLAAALEVGALASLLVRLAFFRPDPDADLARMRRSQRARARRLLALAAAVLAEDDQRRIAALRERIRRQWVRLNETTLMIDAHLVTSRPRTAAVEAQRSFDAELALSNAARFAVALAEKGAAAAVRRPAARALASLLDGDPGAVSRTVAALRAAPCDDDRMTVLVSRLAHSVEHYAAARERLGRPVSEEEVTAAGSDFTPAAPLVNGWLPGSTPVSTEASTTSGRGPLDRATMPPYLRTTIQIAVAGTLAVLAGNAISGQRVYWAVLTVFVSFLMVNNTGEQVRRALFRAGGTAIGIVLGDLFVHLTGGHVWASVLVVLVAMFLGVYLLRINYMFLTIAITVMIAQLYVQLDEFSWHVLLLRLAETAVGVAAVVLTVLVIVPLRPQRVLATGVLQWLRALRTLVEAVLGRFDGTREPLPPLVRGVDAAYAALEATATPLRQVTFGRTSTQVTEVLAATSAARVYARSLTALVEDADAAGAGCPEARSLPLQAAAEQLFASLGAMEHRLVTGEHDDYVRSSSLIAPALDELRRRPRPGLEDALTDLVLLDGALARLAAALQMGVVDHDTGRPTRAQVGSDGRAQTQPSS